MAHATGTLAGTYREGIGSTPATGSVLITPSVDVIRDHEGGVLLVGSRTVEQLDGAFAVHVIATDDLTLDPSGVVYTVTARLSSFGVAPVLRVVVGTGETVQIH